MIRTRFLMTVTMLSAVLAAVFTATPAQADTLPVTGTGTGTGTTITISTDQLQDPIRQTDVTWGH